MGRGAVAFGLWRDRQADALAYEDALRQAGKLEPWLHRLSNDYADAILAFDAEMAQLWGRLRVPHPENPLDKQIAATALMYDLVVVMRNTAHFEATGTRLLNPFR
jgi:predicted nucleic acid-binding protein